MPGFLIWIFALAAAVFAIAFSIRPWQENRSRNWPRAQASLDDYTIVQQGRATVLRCSFSYFVDGRRYRGTYARGGLKSELTRLAASMQQGPLFTRYNPLDPSQFFLDPFRDVTGGS